MAKRAKAADSGEVKEGGAAGDSEEKVFTEAELNAELEARLENERGRIAAEFEDGLRSAGAEGGGFQLVEKDGGAALDPETGKEMTVERYMHWFLSERPGLVRPSQARGAGTGTLGGSQGRYSLEEISEIARTDPKRYTELKGEGVVQEVYERHLKEG